jgi:NAD(P)-dependent dehydrogenase (short-subunit alcohol dehydrogenase family)
MSWGFFGFAAAITDRGTIIDTSPELFDRIFNVNVRGPFFLMQETIKIMRREKIEGNIVNICSMSSKAGQPFIAAYCSSKGALATFTENAAYAVMRNRIRANGVNIGWMATEGEDRIQRQRHGASPDWLKQAAAAWCLIGDVRNGNARRPFSLRSQRGLSECREFVVDSARVSRVAFRHEARFDHAVERAVQRSRPHFDSVLRVCLDLLHDVVAVPLLAEEG